MRFSVGIPALLVLALVILPGCSQQKVISDPYPRWGEENYIERQGSDLPLILRVLSQQEPLEAPACVLLVHGMNEHIGRYHEIARYFSKHYIVAGFDYYAHGLSNRFLQQADKALRAGDTGLEVSSAYLAQIPLSDLELTRQDLGLALSNFITICDNQSTTERPIFIISHSLGSLITASFLLQSESNESAKRVQGLVLLAPAFSVSEPPGWRGWLQNPFIRLSFYTKTHFLRPQGELSVRLIFNQLLAGIIVPIFDGLFEFFSWPGFRIFLSPATPAWVVNYLTDNEKEKMSFFSDDWVVRRSLLRYVKGIEEEIVFFRNHMDEFSKPYLLVSSELDPITPFWGSLDFAEATLKNDPDNMLLVQKNLQYHQHLFLTDPHRQEILTVIEEWLERRIHTLDVQ